MSTKSTHYFQKWPMKMFSLAFGCLDILQRVRMTVFYQMEGVSVMLMNGENFCKKFYLMKKPVKANYWIQVIFWRNCMAGMARKVLTLGRRRKRKVKKRGEDL